jgi:hypothetical protein
LRNSIVALLLGRLNWVNRTTISSYPEGVMPIFNLFDPTDMGATLSGLKIKSAFQPKVAPKASQPWAGRRNAFGIKTDLKCGQKAGFQLGVEITNPLKAPKGRRLIHV